jgi:hypothetical protein
MQPKPKIPNKTTRRSPRGIIQTIQNPNLLQRNTKLRDPTRRMSHNTTRQHIIQIRRRRKHSIYGVHIQILVRRASGHGRVARCPVDGDTGAVRSFF